MLHIVPQRRPTAIHIYKHPWLNPRVQITQNNQYINVAQVGDNNTQGASDLNYNQNEGGVRLKETVAATFRAIASSPQAAHLGPVVMSDLARRRFKDKGVVKK